MTVNDREFELRGSTLMQGLGALLREHRWEEARAELARAEVAGEIAEFYVIAEGLSTRESLQSYLSTAIERGLAMMESRSRTEGL